MTDEQIVNRLNLCAHRDIEADCYECATEPVGWDECREWLMRKALGLINRQKREIEKLRSRDEEFLLKNYSFDKYYDEHITRAKFEAIKEFAERLKRKPMGVGKNGYVHVSDIDYLVEEMMEDKK